VATNVTPIRIAVIGAGFMGSLYARICSQIPGVEVAAICDIMPERVVPLADELGAAAYATDYDSLFDEQNVDAALICTCEDAHVKPALAALAAAKHILVEKPLAMNLADVEAIVSAASHVPGVVAMVAHSLRFDPRYVALRDAVVSGQIGDTVMVSARRTPPFNALERVAGRVELPFWVGVHDIDMMRWTLQAEVTRVVAVASDRGLENRDLRRAILALVTFTNGVIGVLDNSWGPQSDAGGQQSTAGFRVQGTAGFVEVRNQPQDVVIQRGESVFSPDTIYMPSVHGRIAGVYPTQIEHFIDCIRHATAPQAGLEDGRQAVAVAEAILQSARLGQAVQVRKE
jgi:UDP-N-acetylglucosamine 3-dehydrogenase